MKRQQDGLERLQAHRWKAEFLEGLDQAHRLIQTHGVNFNVRTGFFAALGACPDPQWRRDALDFGVRIGLFPSREDMCFYITEDLYAYACERGYITPAVCVNQAAQLGYHMALLDGFQRVGLDDLDDIEYSTYDVIPTAGLIPAILALPVAGREYTDHVRTNAWRMSLSDFSLVAPRLHRSSMTLSFCLEALQEDKAAAKRRIDTFLMCFSRQTGMYPPVGGMLYEFLLAHEGSCYTILERKFESLLPAAMNVPDLGESIMTYVNHCLRQHSYAPLFRPDLARLKEALIKCLITSGDERFFMDLWNMVVAMTNLGVGQTPVPVVISTETADALRPFIRVAFSYLDLGAPPKDLKAVKAKLAGHHIWGLLTRMAALSIPIGE